MAKNLAHATRHARIPLPTGYQIRLRTFVAERGRIVEAVQALGTTILTVETAMSGGFMRQFTVDRLINQIDRVAPSYDKHTASV